VVFGWRGEVELRRVLNARRLTVAVMRPRQNFTRSPSTASTSVIQTTFVS
jgi:hypothetical protein